MLIRQKYLINLTRYLDGVVELPLYVRSGRGLPDFAAELVHYEEAKGKKHTLICTLCNSAYPTEEQSDNAVLFQPWVYKNKLSLYAGKNTGGICAICALELMLRQILQKGQLRLTGSDFEALKTKFVSVYPNFFFTAETGAMVQGVLDQLQDINFFTIRRQLDGQDITMRDVLELNAFAAPEKEEKEIQPPQAMPENLDEVTEDEEGNEPATSHERSYIKFHTSNYPGLCFFGMKVGKDDDDTSTWAMPAFLALALPLVTGTKVVVSEMSLPLYSSGRDFRETVIFDAPHPFLDRLLKTKRVRVNELLRKLRVLASMYRVNLDTYASKGRPEWKHLNAIARDLDTDPLLLFSYLHEQERRDGRDFIHVDDARDYLRIYETILEADVSKIKQCVDLYRFFYRAGYQSQVILKSHAILKPVDIVAKAIINSPLNIEEDDLLWQIQGELQSWLDRVRSRQATGRALFWGKDISEKEPAALQKFVTYFHNAVFKDYCESERGILRSRINQFKNGCEAYYRSLEGQEPETPDESEEAETASIS
jgi:CRISPR-associated protein Csc3